MKWSDDGSRNDSSLWLVYSMSKEDIWVSRIPVPIQVGAARDDEPWNTYCPKWSSLKIAGKRIEIVDRDRRSRSI